MAWMFRWFWYFVFNSLCGFGCEVLFSRLTGGRRDRKGMLLLPLCPVYGLGACAILLLPPVVRAHTMPLFFLGGLAAAQLASFALICLTNPLAWGLGTVYCLGMTCWILNKSKEFSI